MDKVLKLKAVYEINKKLLKLDKKEIKLLSNPSNDLNSCFKTTLQLIRIVINRRKLLIEKQIIISEPKPKSSFATGGMINEKTSENITHKAAGNREEIVNAGTGKTE